jgi:RHS repeat-associated protein
LTRQAEQFQAKLIEVRTDLVNPFVLRQPSSSGELWVLSRGDASLRVLDNTGKLTRQLQLVRGDWSSFAINESAKQVEQVYLASRYNGTQKLWLMPVTPLALDASNKDSNLQGREFLIKFNRAINLTTLSTEYIHLNAQDSAKSINIGLQLAKPDTVKVTILDNAASGFAVLQIGKGLKDTYGNTVASDIRIPVQISALASASAPSTADTTNVQKESAPTVEPVITNTSTITQPGRKVTAAIRSSVRTNVMATAVAVPTTLQPITSGFSAVRGGATDITYTSQIIQLNNATANPITGPVYLSVENLPSTVKLLTPTEGYNLQTGGLLVPAINMGQTLASGTNTTIGLLFDNPSFVPFTYIRRTVDASQQTASGIKLRVGSLKPFPIVQQILTLQNTSGTDIKGPLYLAVSGLPVGATLYNAAGTDPTTGLPIVEVDLGTVGKITPGQQVPVTLQFQGTSSTSLNYTTSLLGIPVPPNNKPRIDTVTPNQVSVNQIVRVTVEGVNLTNVNAIQFSSGSDIVGRVLYGSDIEKVFEITVNPIAPVGARTITVSGSSGVSNILSLNVVAPPPVAANTSLTGRVLTGEAIPKPLAGVRVFLDEFPGYGDTFTDANGNFTLNNLPQMVGTIAVDGQVISTSTVSYPKVIIPVQIVAGKANKLPYIAYLTANDSAGTSTIPATISQDIKVTNPNNPLLTVTIPAGTTIKRPDGTTVTSVTATPVTPDQTPMPFPVGIAPIQLLSLQPSDAVLSQPTPVTYPNLYKNALPGDQLPLYRADHETGAYVPYGTGTVSADGKLIVPNTDPATGKPYGLPAFSWHFAAPPKKNQGSGGPPKSPQGPPGSCGAGNMVDLASGTEKYISTEIGVLGGRTPFSVTRVYRSEDTRQGPFGIGSAHSFELIIQEQSSHLSQLVQPNNYRTPFSLVNGQTSQFVNTDDPGFRGSILTKANGSYVLKRKSGETMTFGVMSTTNGINNYFLTSLTDRNNNSITIARDSGGNITQISSVSGSLTFNVDQTTGLIQKITDQGGRSVNYQYDNLGRLTTVTDPLNQTITYTYDSANRLLNTTNRRGITAVQRAYDINGHMVTETLADGSQIRYSYTFVNPSDSNSAIVAAKVIYPNGNSVTHKIDEGLYSCSVADGFGNLSQSLRSTSNNRVSKIIDRIGRVTIPTFDDNENLIQVQAPDGSITKTAFESNFDLPVLVTDALNKVTTMAYDSKGNLLSVKDPLNHITTNIFDGFGQLTSITNALSQTTTVNYDSRGNTTSVIDPLSHAQNAVYDILNRITSIVDAQGEITSFQYDNLDRIVQVTSAEGRTVKFSYDANSNLLSITDPNNNVTTYEYDSRNRLVKRTDALGKFENYTYDASNNVIQFTDRKGQITTYTYDANDRLVSTTFADSSSITRIYDNVDRLLSMNDTAPGAGQHIFSYDNVNRMTQEVTPRGTVAYSYDLLGRRTSLTVNASRTLTYGYDANNKLTSITEGDQVFGFGYDNLDRRNSLSMPNGVNANYAYDTAGRLTEIVYTKGNTVLRDLQYAYNERNQRISYDGNTAPSPAETAVTSATLTSLNQYSSLNGQSLSYDNNGNQTVGTSSGLSYTAQWNARDQLVGLSGTNLIASFTYDALGRRTTKNINGQSQTYLYDGADIVNESGSNNAVYTHGSGVDEPLLRKSSTNEYYLADNLGSIIGLTDNNGSLNTAYNYSPFGKTLNTGVESSNPYKFTGREDDGNDLYFFRARYYNSDQKRFIGEDPAELSGGDSNYYAYAANDPINRTDPTGLSVESFLRGVAEGGAVGLIFGFAIGAAIAATGGAFGAAIAILAGIAGTYGLIEQLKAIANSGCDPDYRDYLIGQLLGSFLTGGIGGKLGGALGRGAKAALTGAGSGKTGGAGGAGGCSFAAGTPVATKEGDKPIEQVKTGDKVLSKNEQTGEQSYHRVLQTFATPDDEIYSLQLKTSDGQQETLFVTGNHPFWLKGKGWTETDLLKSGDLMGAKDRKWLTVIAVQPTQEKATGYNLEVEADHTYFVGSSNVWVHNNNCYLPQGTLNQQNYKGVEIPLPDPSAQGPHTTLGTRTGSDGVPYRQSATFPSETWPKANGQDVPWSRVDWTDHNMPWDHPNPHQHVFTYDSTNFWQSGPQVPFHH